MAVFHFVTLVLMNTAHIGVKHGNYLRRGAMKLVTLTLRDCLLNKSRQCPR